MAHTVRGRGRGGSCGTLIMASGADVASERHGVRAVQTAADDGVSVSARRRPAHWLQRRQGTRIAAAAPTRTRPVSPIVPRMHAC